MQKRLKEPVREYIYMDHVWFPAFHFIYFLFLTIPLYPVYIGGSNPMPLYCGIVDRYSDY